MQQKENPISMKPATLDRSIDWAVDTCEQFIEIVFLGGEPTLEPMLIERAVQRAELWESLIPVKFHFTMTSNFLNLDEDMARKLAQLGVSYLLSVDGYGERHDISRPAKDIDSPFQLLMQRIGTMKIFQPRMSARVTSTPKTVTYLKNDLEKLYEMGFDHFIISPATGIPWSDESLTNFVDQLANFASNRKASKIGRMPTISPVDDKPKGRASWGCGAGRGRFAIDPSGDIFACARFAGLRNTDRLKLGNIYSGIDHTGNILKFQDNSYHSRPGCLHCYVRERCLGGCPAINWEDTGSLTTPSPNECRMMRAMESIQEKVNLKIMY
jgi:uncharacterized protein